MALRPAHETKHIPLLQYPFRTHLFHLTQLDNGATNGTGLWLGAQCLSLYLSDLLRNKSASPSGLPAGAHRPNTAIELGSGIGLSALALASMGWDVIATDLQDVISAVLSPNVSRNHASLPPGSGAIQVRVLDWTVPPESWLWNNPNVIASQQRDLPLNAGEENRNSILRPPFDLIVSSDTLYLAELVTPLMRSLHEVSRLSVSASPEAPAPPIYLCVERRDPGMMNRALTEAKEVWNFKVERVPHKRLAKAMMKGGARWEKGEWDDVEIWKLILQT